MRRRPKKTVYGQPSFVIETRQVRLVLTERGGHMAPVRFFRDSKAPFEPYRVAPWHSEKTTRKLPGLLRVLRGDFFCLPFGGNEKPYGRERHPPHGETANNRWALDNLVRAPQGVAMTVSMPTTIRRGLVRKTIALVEGETIVYDRHVVHGLKGAMCFGHHAMLAFPDGPGSGLIAVSPFRHGQVYPGDFEKPEAKGYSILKPGAEFQDLARVERIDGTFADLTSYPARHGFEDLVLVCADPSIFPAWSAVTFAAERTVWFTLRDPAVLASTILWHDNGGRHYPPWNGRSVDTLGVEDVTAYFHDGLSLSAAPNPLKDKGIATDVILERTKPFAVNYIQGAVKTPKGFGRVRDIRTPDPRLVLLCDENGLEVPCTVRWKFLRTGILGIPELEGAEHERP